VLGTQYESVWAARPGLYWSMRPAVTLASWGWWKCAPRVVGKRAEAQSGVSWAEAQMKVVVDEACGDDDRVG